jgi:hypothetical protein
MGQAVGRHALLAAIFIFSVSLLTMRRFLSWKKVPKIAFYFALTIIEL